MKPHDLDLSVCPVCGKKFIPAVYHSYKIRNSEERRLVKVCSYDCMRKESKK